jgi:hypothetical protein
MPKVFYSSVIPASIDRIWTIVRDFKMLLTVGFSGQGKLATRVANRTELQDDVDSPKQSRGSSNGRLSLYHPSFRDRFVFTR